MVKPVTLDAGNAGSLAGKSFIFKLYQKTKYELPVFVLLLLLYLPQKLSVTTDIYSMLHIFDYRIGFAPRLFIGSVMSLFTDYKSQAFMDDFFCVVFILEAVLFAFVAGRIIRKAGDESKEIAALLIALFLAVPYSLASLYPRLLSVDRVLVIFTLFALIVLNKKGFKWLVPALIFMSLATYTGYAFTYMPAVALLLIYEVYRNNYSKQSILLCFLSFVTMAGFSAYFFLYEGVDNFNHVDDLVAYAAGKTDLPFVGYFKDVVDTLLIKSPENLWNTTLAMDLHMRFYGEITATIFLLPLIAVFVFLWINAIKASSNKFEKLVFVLGLLAPVARFPMFILSTNFYRGRIAVVVVQFFLIFYFLYTGNPAVTAAAKRLGEFFKNHFLLYLLLIAYFALAFFSFRTGEVWNDIRGALVGRV